MAWFDFTWTDVNTEKLAQHGISQDDFIEVVCHPEARGRSHTGRPAAWGYTPDGRFIMCVYEFVDPVTVHPITAFEVKEP